VLKDQTVVVRRADRRSAASGECEGSGGRGQCGWPRQVLMRGWERCTGTFRHPPIRLPT
jgi:hypothetical protein